MRTRTLAFPAFVGAVMALDGCGDRLTGVPTETRLCHDDTVQVVIVFPTKIVYDTLIFHEPLPLRCRMPKAA